MHYYTKMPNTVLLEAVHAVAEAKGVRHKHDLAPNNKYCVLISPCSDYPNGNLIGCKSLQGIGPYEELGLEQFLVKLSEIKQVTVIKLNDEYDAMITNDGVVVGCQTVPFEKVKEVHQAVLEFLAEADVPVIEEPEKPWKHGDPQPKVLPKGKKVKITGDHNSHGIDIGTVVSLEECCSDRWSYAKTQGFHIYYVTHPVSKNKVCVRHYDFKVITKK